MFPKQVTKVSLTNDVVDIAIVESNSITQPSSAALQQGKQHLKQSARPFFLLQLLSAASRNTDFQLMAQGASLCIIGLTSQFHIPHLFLPNACAILPL